MENKFNELIKIKCKVEKKGQFNYVSWAEAWKELKKIYPNSKIKIYERETIKEGIIFSTGQVVFPAGKEIEQGGFVKVGVIVDDVEHIELYPITNVYNKPIRLNMVNCMDINTAIKRATTKAIAHFGVGLYVYEGEDFPQENV
jgi:hypothetical protein